MISDTAFNWIMGFIGLVCVVGIVLIGVMGYKDNKSANEARLKLIQQCMDDGKKQYECVALFQKAQSSTTFIPMFIPVGR